MFDRQFLKQLRVAELDAFTEALPAKARVLEIGAGQGEQARALARRGFDVTAIDLVSSGYAGERVSGIIDFDGRNIPFADGSFDAVLSSNALEHVEDLPALLSDIRRVTAPGGIGLHAMPTPAWRFWTLLAGPPTAVAAIPGLLGGSKMSRQIKIIAGALLPIGHGTAHEGISELWTFRAAAWNRRLSENGFEVVETRPIGLFHTGHMLLGRRLSIATRRKLAAVLGSAARLYVAKVASVSRHSDGRATGRRESRST